MYKINGTNTKSVKKNTAKKKKKKKKKTEHKLTNFEHAHCKDERIV